MRKNEKLKTLVERVTKRLAETMGSTSHDTMAKTIPASKSRDEQEMSAELAGKNTRNPQAMPMSQKSMKVNAIKKALDSAGYTSTQERAKEVTQNLSKWYDTLDPSDALVYTAQDLAQRYTDEHGNGQN